MSGTGYRVDRNRRSAKGLISDYANELLLRTKDPGRKEKLLAIETIAFRMNWTDLYEKLRFKSGLHQPETTEEKWWQK